MSRLTVFLSLSISIFLSSCNDGDGGSSSEVVQPVTENFLVNKDWVYAYEYREYTSKYNSFNDSVNTMVSSYYSLAEEYHPDTLDCIGGGQKIIVEKSIIDQKLKFYNSGKLNNDYYTYEVEYEVPYSYQYVDGEYKYFAYCDQVVKNIYKDQSDFDLSWVLLENGKKIIFPDSEDQFVYDIGRIGNNIIRFSFLEKEEDGSEDYFEIFFYQKGTNFSIPEEALLKQNNRNHRLSTQRKTDKKNGIFFKR